MKLILRIKFSIFLTLIVGTTGCFANRAASSESYAEKAPDLRVIGPPLAELEHQNVEEYLKRIVVTVECKELSLEYRALLVYIIEQSYLMEIAKEESKVLVDKDISMLKCLKELYPELFLGIRDYNGKFELYDIYFRIRALKTFGESVGTEFPY